MTFAREAHDFAKKHGIDPSDAFRAYSASGLYVPVSRSPRPRSPRRPRRYGGMIDNKLTAFQARVTPRFFQLQKVPRRYGGGGSACAGLIEPDCNKSPRCTWRKKVEKENGQVIQPHCARSLVQGYRGMNALEKLEREREEKQEQDRLNRTLYFDQQALNEAEARKAAAAARAAPTTARTARAAAPQANNASWWGGWFGN